MERPPVRRDLMDIRLRRGQDSRSSTRHSHAKHYHNEAPRMTKRQDTPGTITTPNTSTRKLLPSSVRLTSPTLTRSTVVSQPPRSKTDLTFSIMSLSQGSGVTTSAQSNAAPIAQSILSEALIKSSAAVTIAAAGVSTSASVPGALSDSAATVTPASATAQPTSPSSLSSSRKPATSNPASSNTASSNSSAAGSSTGRVSALDVPAASAASAASAAANTQSSSNPAPSSSQPETSSQPEESPQTPSAATTGSVTSAAGASSSNSSTNRATPAANSSSQSANRFSAASVSSPSPSTTLAPSLVGNPPSSYIPGGSSQDLFANPSSIDSSSFVPSYSSTGSLPGATEAYGLGGSSAGSNAEPDQDSSSGNGVPTPTVVGSVIGGVAGLSIILIILLFVFRRIKRKRKALDVTPSGLGDYTVSRSIEPSGDGPYAGPFAEGTTRDLGPDTAGAEEPVSPILPQMTEQRGFERISGYKLPSRFSPGVQGPSGTVRHPSGTPSYYQNSSNYPSGATASSAALVEDPFADSPFADPPGAVSPRSPSSPILSNGMEPHRRTLGDFAPIQSGQERYNPGPSRIPVVHQVPNISAPRATAPAASPLLSSVTTPDSRSSRFQEDFV